MRLADGLRIDSGRFVAFVGAGGKTSAIRRLVKELHPLAPVIVSTTTRLALGQSNLAACHMVVTDGKEPAELGETLKRVRSVLLTGPQADEEPKWTGLDPEVLERVYGMTKGLGAVLLVEADGARGRSLKAPAAHEPVIPTASDRVVCVAGLDVLGMPLSSEHVHRPEKLSEILGLSGDHLVSEEDVASALLSSEGGRKGVPPGAEFRVLLNKADDPQSLDRGREVAAAMLRSPQVNAVVIASLEREPPVHEVRGRVAGIILAAGGSARLGKPKQLVKWRGRPLIRYSARAALEAGLSPVVVVLGSAAEGVRAALQGEEVSLVANPHWATGQSSSVRAGLRALPQGVEAAMFLLADMPLVNVDLVTALIAEYRRTMGPIVAPRVGDEWGSPVLFDRAAFPALRELEGDRGGKSLFGRFRVVAVPCDKELLLDIDTEEDIRRLKEHE